MEQDNLIAAADICLYHGVEYTFINSLNDAGLLTVKFVGSDIYVSESELLKLEKMIRMHHELEINLAGIEAITHLLDRVEQMQLQIRTLHNRVHLTFVEDI